jgi:hypothetical protein
MSSLFQTIPVTSQVAPSSPRTVVGTKRSVEECHMASPRSTKRHATSRGSVCKHATCSKLAKMGGLCIAHGGGRRCRFAAGCKSSDQGGGFCKRHGGGKRCQFDGCEKSDVGFGRCTLHGGGHRCQHVGSDGKICGKSDQGGGRRGEPNLRRCKTHGGGRKCKHPSLCTRSDAGGGLCRQHGGGRKRIKKGSKTSLAAACSPTAQAPSALLARTANLVSGLEALLPKFQLPTSTIGEGQFPTFKMPQRWTAFSGNLNQFACTSVTPSPALQSTFGLQSLQSTKQWTPNSSASTPRQPLPSMDCLNSSTKLLNSLKQQLMSSPPAYSPNLMSGAWDFKHRADSPVFLQQVLLNSSRAGLLRY